jgi:hypothetical protein
MALSNVAFPAVVNPSGVSTETMVLPALKALKFATPSVAPPAMMIGEARAKVANAPLNNVSVVNEKPQITPTIVV